MESWQETITQINHKFDTIQPQIELIHVENFEEIE